MESVLISSKTGMEDFLVKYVIRIVSIALILAILLCALPLASSAEGTVPFSDVRISDWFYDGVQFAFYNSLMNGTSYSNFSPNSPMTRAMLVTVLWRYSGSSSSYYREFSDVAPGTWYSDAVSWASAGDIVNGTGKGKFSPNGNVTREQLAAILYRYCQMLGYDTSSYASLRSYPDGYKVSSWAYDAVSWAISENIINGTNIKGSIFIDPQGNASRAQVATILMRFIQNVLEPYSETSIFQEISGKEFMFSSGMGAWATTLKIRADGCFYGSFSDYDMGEVYYSNFSGQFSEAYQLTDTIYILHLDYVSYADWPGYNYYKDGVHYYATEPYGLEEGEDFILYLPGTPTAYLEDDFISWAALPLGWMNYMPKYMNNYGLLNLDPGYGFICFD